MIAEKTSLRIKEDFSKSGISWKFLVSKKEIRKESGVIRAVLFVI